MADYCLNSIRCYIGTHVYWVMFSCLYRPTSFPQKQTVWHKGISQIGAPIDCITSMLGGSTSTTQTGLLHCLRIQATSPVPLLLTNKRCHRYTVWIVYTVTRLLLELTVWYLSANSRLTAASTRLPHGKKNLRLTAACIRLSHGVLNAFWCLYLETAVWRPPPHGCLTVYRTTASQPPANGRLVG